MCLVSMVIREASTEWPNPYDIPAWPTHPGQSVSELERIIKDIIAAKEADEAAGNKDCSEDEKKDYLEILEKRVAALEAAQRSEEDAKIT